MGILSKEEKEEFLKSSRCLQLKKDFQQIRSNRYLYFTKAGEINLDKYVKWLHAYNITCNERGAI